VRTRRALIVVSLVVGALGAGQEARASTPGTFGGSTGFSPGGLFVWQSADDLNADLDAIAASGARWVRMDLGWASVEEHPGAYRWSAYDRAVDAARARGIDVLFILAYAPSWATGCAGTDKCMPTADNVPAFGAFAGAAALHFRGRVAAYEVLNEPNQKWSARTPDPERYVAMAHAAYPAIKSADASATVLVGAAGAIQTGGGQYGPFDWAKALWDSGIDGSFDAWSAHPYTFPALPAEGGTEHWSGWWAMVRIHDFLAANGRDVPMWMTEFGTPTRGKGYPDTYQSDAVLTAIDAAASYPWAGPLFLYALRDTGNGGGTEASFGLLHNDRSPKPAWQPLVDKLRTRLDGRTPAPIEPAPAPPPPLATPQTALPDATPPTTVTTTLGALPTVSTAARPNVSVTPKRSSAPWIVALSLGLLSVGTLAALAVRRSRHARMKIAA
jgi:hypothetical protein